MEDKTVEIEQMKAQLSESDASLERSLQTVLQCRRLGDETLQGLERQGEQISRLREEVGEVKMKQKAAEKKISSIESPVGWAWSKILPAPSCGAKKPRSHRKARPEKEESPRNSPSAPSCSQELARLAPDVAPAIAAETASIDRKLDAISSVCADLKSQAIEMGSVMKSQQGDLQKLSKETASAGSKVGKLNNRIETLL